MKTDESNSDRKPAERYEPCDLLLLVRMIGHLDVSDNKASALLKPESSSNTVSTSSKRMTLILLKAGGGPQLPEVTLAGSN
jgi:hypothetical protein